ncbi:hypothetical protein L2E82_11723 [Cichorium intybus]|uniref:Uncharacterized protein n=1 Tax=Cichorium intybus TaxID=13427 RepID=A0ACB9GER0_CICIN|nr:hypothetical protein L2E82_11723 [Cichorium intybus]
MRQKNLTFRANGWMLELDGAANVGNCTFDVAATEPGGSELIKSTKLDIGECEAVVIVRDDSLDVKVDELGEALEEGGEMDVQVLPIVDIGEREETMLDVKSDGVEIVLTENGVHKRNGSSIDERVNGSLRSYYKTGQNGIIVIVVT